MNKIRYFYEHQQFYNAKFFNLSDYNSEYLPSFKYLNHIRSLQGFNIQWKYWPCVQACPFNPPTQSHPKISGQMGSIHSLLKA